MSDVCLNCGGLIMEPGVPYQFAGKVCHCVPPTQYQKPASKFATGFNITTNVRYASQEEVDALRAEYDKLKAERDQALAEVEQWKGIANQAVHENDELEEENASLKERVRGLSMALERLVHRPYQVIKGEMKPLDLYGDAKKALADHGGEKDGE